MPEGITLGANTKAVSQLRDRTLGSAHWTVRWSVCALPVRSVHTATAHDCCGLGHRTLRGISWSRHQTPVPHPTTSRNPQNQCRQMSGETRRNKREIVPGGNKENAHKKTDKIFNQIQSKQTARYFLLLIATENGAV